MCASRCVFVRRMRGLARVCAGGSVTEPPRGRPALLQAHVVEEAWWAAWGSLFTHHGLLVVKLVPHSHSPTPCPAGYPTPLRRPLQGCSDAWRFPATLSKAHPPPSWPLRPLAHSCHLRQHGSQLLQPFPSPKCSLSLRPTSVFTLISPPLLQLLSLLTSHSCLNSCQEGFHLHLSIPNVTLKVTVTFWGQTLIPLKSL